MTLNDALFLTGAPNRAQLAKILGISPMAIYRWDTENIPWARALQVHEYARMRTAVPAHTHYGPDNHGETSGA